MALAELITQTPRGSSIQRVEGGKFMVCDSEQSCFVARSLYLAEEHLEEIEHGYSFPYSTSFRIAWTDLLTGLRRLGNGVLQIGMKTY